MGLKELEHEAQGSYDSNAMARLAILESRTPGSRALSRVLAAFTARELAELPDDYRIVYSDQPTRMQRPLPPGVVAALKNLPAEQDLWSDVQDALQGGSPEVSGREGRRFNGRIGRILVAVTKTRYVGVDANIELIVADRGGVVLLRSNRSVRSGPDSATFRLPEPQPGERAIEPSSLVSFLTARIQQPGSSRKQLPGAFADILLNPELHEPLAYGAGDTFVKVAEAKKLNMVAELPDNAILVGHMTERAKLTPSRALYLFGGSRVDIRQADGWLDIAPILPATARSRRLDRDYLGVYLRSVNAKGRESLDDLAGYLVKTHGDMRGSLGPLLAGILLTTPLATNYEPAMLHLYGLLSVSRRQSLDHGGILSLSGLTPEESEVVNKMVYGRLNYLSPKRQADPRFNENERTSFWAGIWREPTELLGNGFPAGSTLRLTDSSEPALLVDGRPMDPDQIAYQLYNKERPGVLDSWMLDQSTEDVQRLLFGQGTRRNIVLSFEFGDIANMSGQLSDVSLGDSGPVPYSQLPQSFLDAVQKALSSIRKDYANVKPGDRTKTKVPPPAMR